MHTGFLSQGIAPDPPESGVEFNSFSLFPLAGVWECTSEDSFTIFLLPAGGGGPQTRACLGAPKGVNPPLYIYRLRPSPQAEGWEDIYASKLPQLRV